MACSRMPKCRIRPYGDRGRAAGRAGTTVARRRSWCSCCSARSAEPPQSSGITRVERVEHLAAGLAGGDRPCSPANSGSLRVPAVRQPALARSGRARRPGPGWPPPRPVESGLPGGVRVAAAVDDLAGVGEHLVRAVKLTSGSKPEDLLGLRDLVGAERGAVGLAGVLLVRRRPADDRLRTDDRGSAARSRPGPPTNAVRTAPGRRRRRVDVLHVPAVGLVARGDVLAERDVGVALDRDVVVVVEHDQVAELLVAGQRLASEETPSSMSPSETKHADGVVEDALARRASGSNRPRSQRDAIAMPTALAMPWPSGPVVVSTPRVWPCSGWPGVSEPHCRSSLRSSSVRP